MSEDGELTDEQQLDKLESEWKLAFDTARTAQADFDAVVRGYVVRNERPPTLAEQEVIDDLWYCEAEKRGNLDEFISERFVEPIRGVVIELSNTQ